MKKKRSAPKRLTRKRVRLSVGFDPADYCRLVQLAADSDASLGWIIRRAVRNYRS